MSRGCVWGLIVNFFFFMHLKVTLEDYFVSFWGVFLYVDMNDKGPYNHMALLTPIWRYPPHTTSPIRQAPSHFWVPIRLVQTSIYVWPFVFMSTDVLSVLSFLTLNLTVHMCPQICSFPQQLFTKIPPFE